MANAIEVKDLVQAVDLLLGHLYWLSAQRWLADGEPEVDLLVGFVLRPEGVLHILYELVNVEHVSEVDEAVGLVGLGVVVVHGQLQEVEVVLVVRFEVGSQLLVGIPARNVLNHKVSPSFLSSQDLV